MLQSILKSPALLTSFLTSSHCIMLLVHFTPSTDTSWAFLILTTQLAVVHSLLSPLRSKTAFCRPVSPESFKCNFKTVYFTVNNPSQLNCNSFKTLPEVQKFCCLWTKTPASTVWSVYDWRQNYSTDLSHFFRWRRRNSYSTAIAMQLVTAWLISLSICLKHDGTTSRLGLFDCSLSCKRS